MALDASRSHHAVANWPAETAGPRSIALGLRSGARWLVIHREAIWLAAILLTAALAHGVNMRNFPYYEDDEGTYMSQAWAVVAQSRLAPYTYWYDHAPLGWIQIAGWSVLTGGFHTFGSAIMSGRVLMLVMQLGSTWMVYRIGRSLSQSALAPTIASLLFALSSYGIYYHRRVLLDNICAFWLLASILVLVWGEFSLKRAWLSAAALGVSILSKEVTIFAVPAIAILVLCRAHRSHRWFAVVGWFAIVGSIVSTYVLMATIKGELFPPGTLLGGSNPHVSLLGTLQFQSSRGKDAGLFDLSSNFGRGFRYWEANEPLLVLGGSASAAASLLWFRRNSSIMALGLTTLCLWAFLARGGEVIDFYLVPLLPLLALNLGLVLEHAVCWLRSKGWLRRTGALLPSLVVVLTVAGVLSEYRGSSYLPGNPLLFWTGRQAIAQEEASAWIEQHVPPGSTIIIDQFAWLDLHAPASGGAPFTRAHYYWKVQFDPAIMDGVFHDDWRTTDYILVTPQLLMDVHNNQMTFIADALDHSTVVAQFDTGGWPIEILRVNHIFRRGRPTVT